MIDECKLDSITREIDTGVAEIDARFTLCVENNYTIPLATRLIMKAEIKALKDNVRRLQGKDTN